MDVVRKLHGRVSSNVPAIAVVYIIPVCAWWQLSC